MTKPADKTMAVVVALMLSTAADAADWMLAYTGEAFRNTAGGLERGGGFLGNLDVTVTWSELDWLGPGGSAFLYVLGNHGDSPSERIGDAQTYSNIDAPQALKLYEFWYEHAFADGAASAKFGLIDLNSEFDVVASAGVFQNSSFGIGPDFSQSGVNGPSIFPTTSLGLRIRWAHADGAYAACIFLDGVPGDPDNPRGTHIKLSGEEGWLGTCEGGYERHDASGQERKINLGYWRYSEPTATVDDLSRQRNSGWYASYDQRLWRLAENQTLYGFIRIGAAHDEVNAFDRYRGGGLHWQGPFVADGTDVLGLAVARVENGEPFRRWSASEGAALTGHETAIELTYRFVVTEWLAMQPSIQHIRHPGMNPAVSAATAVSLRFEIGLGGES